MARRRILPLLVILVAPAACAGTASAAQFGRVNGAIEYSAQAGDVVSVTMRGLGTPANRQLSVTAAANTTAPVTGPQCSGSGLSRTCPHTVGGVTMTRLRFRTVGGADRIDASGAGAPVDASLPTDVSSGAGDDTITGSPVADSVFAGAGADRLAGGPGPDVLRGEDGDDAVTELLGADTIVGGPGDDLLDLSGVAGGGMAISLNGLADDGPLGASANVDVERVRGTPETDFLTGGPGPNTLEGGAGNDVIDVRDGGIDAVDCGAGAGDRVAADAVDSVTGCETVELPPAGDPAAVDNDGDGVLSSADCDDDSIRVRPGARDVPGNRIDEDCSGADARLVPVPARVSFLWAAFRDGAEARTLRVRGIPAGGKVQLRCTRRLACGFERRRARVSRAGKANLLPLLKGKRLPAGLVVELRVSAPEHITTVTRFRMRARKLPRKRSLCLPPGVARPERCDPEQ